MIIKELRIKNGYTQKEVARAIGVSLSTYKRYESEIGSIGRAPVTRILALVELYDVSSDYILFNLNKTRDNKI